MALRWGIIGAGRISFDFVAAVETLPETDHKFVAVAGKNKANVDKFADEFNIPKRYDSYEKIVQDPDVDVVYIGNLAPQHFETAKLALENGKPVLCEKPCCINAKQTAKLVEIAKAKNLFFMEAVWTRFFPAFKLMLETIKAGDLGDIYYVSASFGWNWGADSRVKVKEIGGGAIIDIGVYTLQAQQAIFRGLKPIKIVSNGHVNENGVDETTGIVITYPEGKIAVLSCSSNVPLTGESKNPTLHHFDMALRWGILGAGKISFDFVAAVKTLPATDHRVVAVAGRNKANVQQFAAELGIPRWYDDYQKLAEDPDVDVVYIGNLNPQHFDSAKLVMDHNKHVLCEKPCTLNEKQTSRLIQIAKEKNLFFMEAVWSRCFPAYKKMQELISSGAIGDVCHVIASFGFPLKEVPRLKSKELGGGTILDLGVYVLQLQQYVYRGLKPINIVANGHLNEDGVDQNCGAVFTYPDSKLAVVSVSSDVQLPNEAVVIGTKGTLTLPTMWCPTKLIAPDQTYEFELPKSEHEFKYNNSAGLSYEAEEVRQCIRAGKIESSHMPHEETIALAKYMDFLRKEVGVVFPEDSKDY